jgi:hypothetical protein
MLIKYNCCILFLIIIYHFQPEDPNEIRWAHLALLVEFAFELKKALQSINEQSFNHFVLKMGK